jgi:hypothetical protein
MSLNEALTQSEIEIAQKFQVFITIAVENNWANLPATTSDITKAHMLDFYNRIKFIKAKFPSIKEWRLYGIKYQLNCVEQTYLPKDNVIVLRAETLNKLFHKWSIDHKIAGLLFTPILVTELKTKPGDLTYDPSDPQIQSQLNEDTQYIIVIENINQLTPTPQ